MQKGVLMEGPPSKERKPGSLLAQGNAISIHPMPASTRPVQTYDALVLDARLRQSLATVRSLGKRGLQVAAQETFDGVPTFSSRWCRQAFICPTDGSAQAYLTALEQLFDRAHIQVLIPTTDANVALIRMHRHRLEQYVCPALAQEAALVIATNKERTLEVARYLGLSVPRSVTIYAENEVQAALQEVGLPAVLKPVVSWAWGTKYGVGFAPELITTVDEARRVAATCSQFGVAMLLQEYLSGRREAISFLYAHGRFYARFAQWARRTMPPLGGTSIVRQSIAFPDDSGVQAEHLVSEIGLEGYSEVEFRRDGAGKPFLMEINPRLSASVDIAIRAGVDFPYLLYQWAHGEPIEVVRRYRAGLWMRYLRGDYITTMTSLRQRGRPGVPSPMRALCDFFVSFLVPMHYDYMDWKDPLPAGIAASDFCHYLIQTVGDRLQSNRANKKPRME
jgi:predicted ATP-grasp superfamily ATP-dependent carboligase